MKKLIPIGIVLLIFLGIFGYNKYIEYQIENENPIQNTTADDSAIDDWESNNYLSDEKVVYAAQQFVKKQLKSPSTAKFPTLYKSSVKKTSNNSYIVSSYVDSQNGFGATIRSNYIVELKQKSNGNISLIKIDISQ